MAFQNNRGTGGGFTVTGALTDSANEPVQASWTLTPQAVTFDGTNDYLLRGGGLTGAVDSGKGIISLWIKRTVANVFEFLMGTWTGSFSSMWIRINDDNTIELRLWSNSLGNGVQYTSTKTLDDTDWHNVLISWDSSLSRLQFYIDDEEDFTASLTLDDTYDYTFTNWSIGSSAGGTFGARYAGDMAEFYFNAGESLDLSVIENRRKFVELDAEGGILKPAYLGSDGSIPTGSFPIIYLTGEAVSFPDNQGTGGSFTVTGALTDSTNEPVQASWTFTPQAVTFESTDYLSGGPFTGITNGKQGLISFWTIVTKGLGGIAQFLRTDGSLGFDVQRNHDDGKIRIRGLTSGGAVVLQVVSTTSFETETEWAHIICSWDLATGAVKLFVNDQDETNVLTLLDQEIDYTPTVGWLVNNDAELASFQGDLAEFYFAPNQYLDLSLEANRRLFTETDESGILKPKYIESDGSGPTGIPPPLYLSGDASGFPTNKGDGGDFTLTGALGDSVNEPIQTSWTFVPQAVTFDGTNDWLTRATLLESIDGKKGTVSAWIKVGTPALASSYVFASRGSTSARFLLFVSSGTLRLIGRNSADTIILDLRSSTANFTSMAEWAHVLFSWDLETGVGKLYINDVEASDVANTVLTNDVIDYTQDSFQVGSLITSGSFLYIGDMAELYVNLEDYIDIEIEANRRLFTFNDGTTLTPKYLGDAGEHPTSNIPALYLRSNALNFNANFGKGGTFTVNGVLDDSANEPVERSLSLDKTGALAATEAQDSASIAGLVPATGTLAVTEAKDTSAASGTVKFVLTLAATESQDSLFIREGIKGTLAANEAVEIQAPTLGAMGQLTIGQQTTGTGEFTGIDTAAVAGEIKNAGTLASTEAQDVASLAATLSDQATLAATEAADTAAIAAAVVATGTLAATEAVDGLAFAVDVAWVATLAVTEPQDTAAVAGTAITAGSLDATEPPDVVAFEGTASFNIIDGTLSVVEEPDTVSLQGTATTFGTIAATEATDTASVEANATTEGTLAATETQDSVSINGSQAAAGTLAATETADSASVTAEIVAELSLAATEAPDSTFITDATLLESRPAADVNLGGWRNELGGTALFPSLDEETPSDTDYIQSRRKDGTADVATVRLADLGARFDTDKPIKIRYRFAKEEETGAGRVDLTVRLLEGEVQIAEWNHVDISDQLVTVTQELSTAQAAALSGNMDDLRISFIREPAE